MTTNGRLTLPEVRARFEAYHNRPENLCWGSLHVVLDDGNYSDDCVRYAIKWAEGEGDTEGAELGRILLKLTKTQRAKLS